MVMAGQVLYQCVIITSIKQNKRPLLPSSGIHVILSPLAAQFQEWGVNDF
jgi:hypothetical protein